MIKKIFTTVLITITMVAVVDAQEYQKFRVGFGIGFTAGPQYGAGLLYTLEPGYHLNDDLVLGIRYEGAGTGLETDGFDKGYRSLSASAQYYVGNKFRAFVGGGVGYYKVNFSGGRESFVGFYPRAGFDVGHGFLALDYNILPTVRADDFVEHYSYLSIRLGVNFGGGKQRE